MQNHHGGVVLYDGCLYGANGGNEGGYLVCLDFKTGKVLWNQRVERQGAPKARWLWRTAGSTTAARTARAPDRAQPRRSTSSAAASSSPTAADAPDWSHPVLANGKLYLRDQDVLLCYDVKAK